jgi:hypothetical protein
VETVELQNPASIDLAREIISHARTLSDSDEQISTVLMIASQLVASDRLASPRSDPKTS